MTDFTNVPSIFKTVAPVCPQSETFLDPAMPTHHVCSLVLPFPFSSISFPLPHFTFVSYCSFPSYSLILHFAAAISPKYCLSCINHWPILAPIPDLPALIEEECGGVGRQTECRGLMLLQQPQEEGEPSSAY